MIPGNTFTPTPILGSFESHVNEIYNPLVYKTQGGVALNNITQGRRFKIWVCYYEAGLIKVKPENEAVVFTLAQANVLSLSLAFDNAMNIVLTWKTSTGVNLYYYDTITLGYITTHFPGVTSSIVSVDNDIGFYTTDSDVLFIYTKNNNLYYRQQRDRYDTERLIGNTTKLIKRVGLSTVNRFQIQLND
jgi:hypothetical protein